MISVIGMKDETKSTNLLLIGVKEKHQGNAIGIVTAITKVVTIVIKTIQEGVKMINTPLVIVRSVE